MRKKKKKKKMRKKCSSLQNRTWSTDTNGYPAIRLELIANRYRTDVQPEDRRTTLLVMWDVVKGLHRTKKGGGVRTNFVEPYWIRHWILSLSLLHVHWILCYRIKNISLMVFIKQLKPRIFVQCKCCYTDWSLAF